MTDRTVGGFFWMLSGSGLQSLLQIITLTVLARLLAPSEFGVVGAALVIIGFSEIFYQLGIGPALVQRAELDDRYIRTGFTVSVAFGALVSLFLFAGAPALAGFFRMDALTSILRVMCVAFLIKGAGVVATSLVQRGLRFRLLATAELAAYFVGYGIIALGLAALGAGAWALVAGFLGSIITSTTILVIKEPHAKSPLIDLRRLRDLFTFGAGFTLAKISNHLALQADNLVVGRLLGAAALGLYGRAYHLMTLPANVIGRSLDLVLFPAMAQVQASTDRLRMAFRRGIAAVSLVVMPLSGLTFILAPEVVAVVLGPRWAAIVPLVQIFAAGMFFRTAYKIGDSVARATGAVYRRAWRQALYASLVATGAAVGQRWGLSGVCVGVLLAVTTNYLLMTHLSIRLTGLSWTDWLRAHRHGAALGLVAVMAAWGAASFARGAASAPVVVLLAGTAAACSAMLLSVRLLPALVLGSDGRWFLQAVLGRLPRLLGWLDQGDSSRRIRTSVMR